MMVETMREKHTQPDIKRQEQTRRTELAMLGLLIEKYPREARERARKLAINSENSSAQINKKPLA